MNHGQTNVSPLDILWVRNLLRPADFGGSRYNWEVTRHLAARGNRVRVVTPRPRGPLPGPTAAELSFYPVSRRTPFETFFTNALGARVVAQREIRRRRPDIVVLSSYDVAFGHFMWPRSSPGVPTAYIYNSSFYSDAVDRVGAASGPRSIAHASLRAFMRWVERRTFSSATTLIGVSPFSRVEIGRRLGRQVDVAVIPTGVDVHLFAPGSREVARCHWGIDPRKRVLLAVGRLARVKRYDRAIDALRILRRQDPSYLLLIAGKGPDENALRELAAPLGDAVRFVGFVDGQELADLYRAADAVLCTSEFENWSVSILEALSSGVPVIGTPRGSIPDLLGLVDPMLVAPNVSPEAIATVTHTLLSDQARQKLLGERARVEIATRFSWERTASELEERFRSATRTTS